MICKWFGQSIRGTKTIQIKSLHHSQLLESNHPHEANPANYIKTLISDSIWFESVMICAKVAVQCLVYACGLRCLITENWTPVECRMSSYRPTVFRPDLCRTCQIIFINFLWGFYNK